MRPLTIENAYVGARIGGMSGRKKATITEVCAPAIKVRVDGRIDNIKIILPHEHLYLYGEEIVFESDTYYHAETEEEANMLLQEAHRQGYKWVSGDSYLDMNYWGYTDHTGIHYNVVNGDWFNGTPYAYKIIKVKDLFKHKTENETIRTTQTDSGRAAGSVIRISDRAGQIATASRLVGNQTRFKTRRAKIISVEIRGETIT